MERRKFIGGLASLLVSPMAFAGEPGDEKVDNKEEYSKPTLEGFKKYYSKFREQTDKDDEFLKRVDERLSSKKKLGEVTKWYRRSCFSDEMKNLMTEQERALTIPDAGGFNSVYDLVGRVKAIASTNRGYSGKLNMDEVYTDSFLNVLANCYMEDLWKGNLDVFEVSKRYLEVRDDLVDSEKSFSERIKTFETRVISWIK